LRVGEAVQLAFADQVRSLDPDKSFYEVISEGMDDVMLGKVRINAHACCGRFDSSGGDQQQKTVALSGGERNRVHLARMLRSGANVLLLDEPTNDPDGNAIRCGGFRTAPPARPVLPPPPSPHQRPPPSTPSGRRHPWHKARPTPSRRASAGVLMAAKPRDRPPRQSLSVL
jgi:hypothetical protein